MQLVIENARPAIAADNLVLGAAVKIIMAEADLRDVDAIKRACGASPHVWRQHGDAIQSLAWALAGQP